MSIADVIEAIGTVSIVLAVVCFIVAEVKSEALTSTFNASPVVEGTYRNRVKVAVLYWIAAGFLFTACFVLTLAFYQLKTVGTMAHSSLFVGIAAGCCIVTTSVCRYADRCYRRIRRAK